MPFPLHSRALGSVLAIVLAVLVAAPVRSSTRPHPSSSARFPHSSTSASPFCKSFFAEAGTACARKVFEQASTGTTPLNGHVHAVVTVSLAKHALGGIEVSANMPDGRGGHAFTHSGIVPGLEHILMREHAHRIGGKAHRWLLTRNA